MRGRNGETGQWAGEQASEPVLLGVCLVLHACMSCAVRCAICAARSWTREGEDIVTLTPDLQDGPGSDNTVHGGPCQDPEVIGRGRHAVPVLAYLAGALGALGWETRCQPASLPDFVCPSCELLCCCTAVVPGPQLAGRSASQQASRPAMRDGHGLSLLREGGRGAWKFVSMHPWAWADADPQLQGWDLDGRCPGLGGPDWVMTCTCNQQLLLLLLPPCCHPAATPNLAPATGAGRARARFVMLFLIPKSTCEVARRMDGLHTTSVSPR